MVKRIVVVLSLALIVAPAIAADLSIGLRWNYIHMLDSGDFWSDYVGDKYIDEYNYNAGEWRLENARANSGLVDDFNGFNAFPGVKASLRFGSIKVDAVDVEFYSRERQISKYNYQASRTGQGENNWKITENLDLETIQFKHSVNYIIEVKDFDYYLGGGINWTMWETYNRMDFYDYSDAPGGEPYPREYQEYTQDGIAFGAHLQAGVEYALTESFSPFVGLTFLYSEDTWEYPMEFDDYWNYSPDDFRLSNSLMSEYDISFTGLRVDFGLVYHV